MAGIIPGLKTQMYYYLTNIQVRSLKAGLRRDHWKWTFALADNGD